MQDIYKIIIKYVVENEEIDEICCILYGIGINLKDLC